MAQVCSINSGISNKAVTLFLINVFFPLTNRNILSYYTHNRKNLHPFEIWSLKLVIGFTWPEAKQDGSLPNRTLSPNVVLRRRNSLFTASNDKTRRRLSSACRQTYSPASDYDGWQCCFSGFLLLEVAWNLSEQQPCSKRLDRLFSPTAYSSQSLQRPNCRYTLFLMICNRCTRLFSWYIIDTHLWRHI